MTFQNSISIKLSELQNERTLEQIQDFDSIELRLTGINSEDHSTIVPAMHDTEANNIDVETVHGTRIPTLGEHPRGASDLMGKARNIEWGYDERGNRTRRLLEPSAIVYHPPYIEDKQESTKREMAEAMVRNITEFENSDLPPEADIAIENLPTKRGIIHDAEDVERVNQLAEEYEVEDEIAYTFDNVHTENVEEIIDAMMQHDAIANVHLSDSIPADDPYVEELKETYPSTNDDGDLLPWRERPGIYTHLPPGEGEEDIEAVLARLEDHGYDGPITFEIHDRFKTPEGYQQTKEEMERLDYPIE